MMDISSGYLIVKTFNKLYQDYVGRYDLDKEIYAIPRKDRKPYESRIKYHGIDRDALDDFKNSDNLAEIYFAELAEKDACLDGFLFSELEINTAFSLIQNQEDYEIIWVKLADSMMSAPIGFHSIGFEPSYFIDDHFSASCDCMLIPRWHGTDKEGELFLEHFGKLSALGLFGSIKDASTFLEYYLSFDWTERGEFEIIEVFIKPKT